MGSLTSAVTVSAARYRRTFRVCRKPSASRKANSGMAIPFNSRASTAAPTSPVMPEEFSMDVSSSDMV